MKELQNYYNNYDEEMRLKHDNLHQIEYLTTIHFLKKYIPPHSKILDCCAGTGIYAFELAREGHTVSAGDIVEKHTEIMRENPNAFLLNDIYCGDITDMSRFSENEFDVVLCFGALYHLLTLKTRYNAIKECLRVLKPNGIFAFSYVTREALYFAQLMTAVKSVDVSAKIEEYKKLDCIFSTGISSIFYGMSIDEPDEIIKKFNLTKITQVAAYPFLYKMYNEINEMSSEDFARYMKCHIITCENNEVVRNTMHGLSIYRK